MAWQIVKTGSKPDNIMNVALNLKERVTYRIRLRYNPVAEYWTMDVSRPATGESIVCGVPLVCGGAAAADLFRQMQYLGIGSCGIFPRSSTEGDRPTAFNLESDFLLVWGKEDG